MVSSSNLTESLKRRKKRGRLIATLAIGMLVIAYVLFHSFFFKVWEINGPSMDPNFVSGQKVVATRSDSSPSRDSVVIIKFPNPKVAGTTDGIKRIVALGGDRVVISNNELTVSDSEHPNGYNPTSNVVTVGATTGNVDITVPSGDVYVLGDNRSNSLDSREFGPLPVNNIVGKVIFKLAK